jgi:hypothetical protein
LQRVQHHDQKDDGRDCHRQSEGLDLEPGPQDAQGDSQRPVQRRATCFNNVHQVQHISWYTMPCCNMVHRHTAARCLKARGTASDRSARIPEYPRVRSRQALGGGRGGGERYTGNYRIRRLRRTVRLQYNRARDRGALGGGRGPGPQQPDVARIFVPPPASSSAENPETHARTPARTPARTNPFPAPPPFLDHRGFQSARRSC